MGAEAHPISHIAPRPATPIIILTAPIKAVIKQHYIHESALVPRPAAERLQSRITERAQATTVPGVLLASQAVKLTGGMFAGQDGTVLSGAAPAGKVRVMLTAYGREVVVPINLIEVT